ncbi:hypothetical protein ASG29_04360 [Sphingomonas sp. Leaf412]|uniref:TetR/AcrR family transcriptional regulator n=1 Tax=Sphingomonas sp. Leaf412 TaxID=1736370 RepID=UPI0006F9AC9A|nr:TetR/AcrR family transcriptional regulator [Sphingomonas sp. Leaf412]KQT35334.1 hypothetical protein ASG29_04360 [Sphingomonas sp. Leaf412]
MAVGQVSAADAPSRSPRATRDARQADLLGHAAAAILEQGGLPLSFERFSRLAGVSKALIYNYFPTQAALGTALLQQELEAVDRVALAQAAALPDPAAAARACAAFYFDIVVARGPLLHLLLADPIVAQGEGRGVAVRAGLLLRPLVRRLRSALDLTAREANAVLHLLMTYPEEAGRKAFRGEANRALARQLCGEAVAAGIAGLSGGGDDRGEVLGADLL